MIYLLLRININMILIFLIFFTKSKYFIKKKYEYSYKIFNTYNQKRKYHYAYDVNPSFRTYTHTHTSYILFYNSSNTNTALIATHVLLHFVVSFYLSVPVVSSSFAFSLIFVVISELLSARLVPSLLNSISDNLPSGSLAK